jgi:hypothetical protein
MMVLSPAAILNVGAFAVFDGSLFASGLNLVSQKIYA